MAKQEAAGGPMRSDWFGAPDGAHGFRDEHGNPARRTKYTHPYNYDGFVLWKSADYTPRVADNTIYSDRLLEWDFAKHDALCEKHFGNRGQYWSERQPEKIEAFLRDWTESPSLRLVLVMEYCNQASGYPCWRFDYITNTQARATSEASAPT